MNGEARHTSSITINVAGNPQIISNGHHNGHQPQPSSSSSASYSPLPSPTSTSTPSVTVVTIPGSLQETGSEEHIVAATSTSTTNRTPHFQICISRVPNTGVNISLRIRCHNNGSWCTQSIDILLGSTLEFAHDML